MNKRLESLKYLLSDYAASASAWTLFYIFRRAFIEPAKYGYSVPIFNFDENFYLAIIFIPVYWIFLYWITGSYRNIYKKSRVREFGHTFTLSFLGTLLLFFILLVDDVVNSYATYRYTFITLLLLQFTLTYTFRFIILTNLKSKMKRRIIGFNTLLVGSNEKALKLFKEMENEKHSQGYRFVGFVSLNGQSNPELAGSLPQLGQYQDLTRVIVHNKVEEVILAMEHSDHDTLDPILTQLEDMPVTIKIIPDMYDIITGSVRLNYIFGTALIEIMPEIMPVWQKNLKRTMDVAGSIIILLCASPLYVALAIAVKLSSKGPLLYTQERIGKDKVPFRIYKFRTMYVDAEKQGPQLSSKYDPRITPIGRVLRKYRLDEFPQFYNVLKGDMSLVGPRPERQYFIDQIMHVAPHYKHLLKVRPGITSWGQVKFGYAENVEQMVERMKFDILYVENMSIAVDIKIIFYTILIMLQGRGK